MPSTTGRRSRVLDFDEEAEDSRAATPTSTAPNDSKRSRRNREDDGILSSRGGTPLSNVLSSISQTRPEKKPLIANGLPITISKYQPGAIVRVKLTNFVTYTSVEFRPGPNLNMVIGPNGTGKSTLHLGRAKDISEFVKNGCREATIEIELQRAHLGPHKTRKNPVITRQIKREGNKSSYTLNGQSSSGKLIQELARTLSIQIDNLCQFLPQDKVVEFAAMTPTELLKSTQQAAAPPQMLEWHEDLKKLRAHQKEVLIENSADKEQLANLENRQEMNRVDVERMKEKITTQKRIGWLERCRPLPQYADAKRKAENAKAKQKQLSAELRLLKAEVEPTLRMVTAKQQYAQQVRNVKEQREKDVTRAEKECDRIVGKLARYDGEMNDCDARSEAERKSRQPKREQLLKIQQVINRLKAQMEQQPEQFDFNAINQQMQEKVERKRQIEAEVTERKQQIGPLRNQGIDKNREITQLNQRLEGLETQAGQQQSKLERMSRDTYRAWQWIQSNRDQFEKQVYGPPMIECSLKDPKMANIMESFFQENDFKIITAQTQKDFDLLQRRLNKEMGLHQISLRVCSIDSLDDDRLHPPVSTERLEALGLESWAIDQIEGPPTVLAMLCMQKSLHQTAISSRDITQEQYDQIEQTGIKTFAAGKTLYQFTRRAEYGAAGTSSKTRQIGTAAVWTNQPVDASAKARLQREIGNLTMDNQEIKSEFDRLRVENDTASKETDVLNQELNELKSEKEDRQKALVAFKALPAMLAQQEEKLASVQENLAGVRERLMSIQQERDRFLVEKAQSTIDFASALTSLKTECQKLLEAEMWHLEAQSDWETLKARNEHVVETLRTKQREEAEASEAAKREIHRAKELVKYVHTLRNEGEELEKQGDSGLSRLMAEMGQRSLTMEDLEAEIDSEKARLDLIQGVGGNVVKEFEERAEKIDKLKERLESFKVELDNLHHAIRELRGKWEPRLEELIARISEKFGESFARIGCAGQVAVFKASSADVDEDNTQMMGEGEEGNGFDFANWAIHISVKFRENEPLSLLDAHRQSGGERAVSTIFYLMALQSLSMAPFRVVDEINQGMDPRNERMVHGRMVDIATPKEGEEGGSQYFLITPKLLSGLKYRPGMTVLCIVSGENMPAAVNDEQDGRDDGAGHGGKQWQVDFGKFVDRARLMRLNSRSQWQGGRRVDSGIGLGSSFGSSMVDPASA